MKNKKDEFYRIVKFVESNTKNKFTDEQVQRAIDFCEFENLKNQEDTFGFKESPNTKNQKFFFLGPKNNWRNIINKDIQKKIEFNFEKEMKELDYL